MSPVRLHLTPGYPWTVETTVLASMYRYTLSVSWSLDRMNPVRTQKTSKDYLTFETVTRIRPLTYQQKVKWVLTG